MHDESPEVKISGKVFVDDENIYGQHVNVIDTRKKMGYLHNGPVRCQCRFMKMSHTDPGYTGLKKGKLSIRQ